MLKTAIIAATFTTMGIFNVVSDFHKELPVPVEVCQEDPRLTDVRSTLRLLGRDTKYAKAIFITATAKNIDPVFWACNIEIESEYKINAVSSKGYKGLGQTKRAIMKLGYEEADLMASACDLAAKVKDAKGNFYLGLCYYKGGNNPVARQCADEAMALYTKVKLKLKDQQHG